MLIQKIQSGEALHKLAGFIKAQGGDSKYVYEPDRFVYGNITASVYAQQEGFVSHIDCDEIGICSLLLGGGRETKESEIDLSVGLYLHKKVGDRVNLNEPVATFYASDESKLTAAKERFQNAFHISENKPSSSKLIKGIIYE